MAEINEHIPQDFACIFERPIKEDGTFDDYLFYILRDDFFQHHWGLVRTGREAPAELEKRFAKKPMCLDDDYQRFACASALYYCRIMEIAPPVWAYEYDDYKPDHWVPIWAIARQVTDLADSFVPEFWNMGFIYPEKYLSVCVFLKPSPTISDNN